MELIHPCSLPAAKNSGGFTFVELLVAMVISGIILMAVFSTFKVQQDVYTAQDQVTELQQNARAAFWYMFPEMRMAGFDPTFAAGAGIVTATHSSFGFTLDIDDDDETGEPDGDTDDGNERVTFGFRDVYDGDDDGMADAGAAPLGRNTGGGLQPFIDNIAAIEFQYTLEDAPPTLTPADFDKIESVEVSILARTKHPDRNFTNNTVYTTASGVEWGPFNDNYRRYLLISSVELRNQGMK